MTLRLRFDRGTLLFRDVPPGLDLGLLEGVRYDDRVRAWRGRACERPRILAELARRSIDVVDETMRALPAPQGPPKVELRPYQQLALTTWLDARRRGVLVLPTGSGKTRIAVAAILHLRCRALVLVPTRILMEQWHDELGRQGISSVGRWGDGRKEPGAVTVATMDAAWRSMETLGDAFDLLVVDEVHRVVGEGRSEALEMSCATHRLGLTATMPDAEATARLDKLVGPVVFVSTIEELAGTYLSPFDLSVLAVELTREERALYDAHRGVFQAWADDEKFFDPDLTIQDLVRRARKTPEGKLALEGLRRSKAVLTFPTHKRALLARLLDEHRGRKVLVFTPDNKTAYRIARDHLVTPMTCDVPKKERARVLDRFRDGTIRALVSSQVLNEGVDVPDADVAIVVGGRAGEREHVQRVGRVLRPVPGKRASIIELVVARSSETRAGERRRAAFQRRPAAP